MPVFQRSTNVPASPAELFRFHGDPRNLRLVAPPGLRILGIDAAPEARCGEHFRVAVKQGPLTLHWEGVWERVEPPLLLVDRGVHCPFAFWQHEHRFDPAPGGAVLTDRVEFRFSLLRGGPVADFFALHFVLPRLFAARHAATRARFADAGAGENPLAGDRSA